MTGWTNPPDWSRLAYTSPSADNKAPLWASDVFVCAVGQAYKIYLFLSLIRMHSREIAKNIILKPEFKNNLVVYIILYSLKFIKISKPINSDFHKYVLMYALNHNHIDII